MIRIPMPEEKPIAAIAAVLAPIAGWFFDNTSFMTYVHEYGHVVAAGLSGSSGRVLTPTLSEVGLQTPFTVFGGVLAVLLFCVAMFVALGVVKIPLAWSTFWLGVAAHDYISAWSLTDFVNNHIPAYTRMKVFYGILAPLLLSAAIVLVMLIRSYRYGYNDRLARILHHAPVPPARKRSNPDQAALFVKRASITGWIIIMIGLIVLLTL